MKIQKQKAMNLIQTIAKLQGPVKRRIVGTSRCIVLVLFLLCSACSLEPKPSDCFAVAPGKNLVVYSSNFIDGYMNLINLDTGTIGQQVFTPANQDSILRTLASNSGLYLLTRGDANTLTRFEAGSDKYCIIYEVSTGLGSNPYDLASTASGQGFVALYNTNDIFSLDLDTGTVDPNGPLDIPDGYDTYNDNIDAAAVYQHGTYLYLLIQDIEQTTPHCCGYSSNGKLLKIDLSSHTVDMAIDLGQKNPQNMRYYSDGSNEELHIFTIGDYGSNPNPALSYDLNSGTVSELLAADPARLDINDVLRVSNTLAFAITSNAAFQQSLIAFNPINGTILNPAILSLGSYPEGICCMLLYNNELYVGSSSTAFTGIAVFESSAPFTRLKEYSLDLAPASMRITKP